jgi:hypothetical protein
VPKREKDGRKGKGSWISRAGLAGCAIKLADEKSGGAYGGAVPEDEGPAPWEQRARGMFVFGMALI